LNATTPSSPVVVLGGSGYVGGELLRLLAGHPRFRVAAVVSESRGGAAVIESFPFLRGTPVALARFAAFDDLESILAATPSLGVFSALPHGESAPRVDALLALAESARCDARVVDLSADFRHADPARYAAIYGKPHAAPERLAEFTCGIPELTAGAPRHVAHPGCFTTAATLALAPLAAGGWIEPRATVVAVTGSTGAGRTPTTTTHHPERRSNLFAYAPLAHRHEPEMRALVARAANLASEPAIAFAPHAGPFARGIHATITARLARPGDATTIRREVSSFYGSFSPFVTVLDNPPHLQSVVGTNRCDLSYVVRDDELIAFSALDNLVKGAAGGGVQWMNRLFSLPETAGLELPGLGWL
jgi:N-acetyl-gamma-glutamyl-phosphate reductase